MHIFGFAFVLVYSCGMQQKSTILKAAREWRACARKADKVISIFTQHSLLKWNFKTKFLCAGKILRNSTAWKTASHTLVYKYVWVYAALVTFFHLKRVILSTYIDAYIYTCMLRYNFFMLVSVWLYFHFNSSSRLHLLSFSFGYVLPPLFGFAARQLTLLSTNFLLHMSDIPSALGQHGDV